MSASAQGGLSFSDAFAVRDRVLSSSFSPVPWAWFLGPVLYHFQLVQRPLVRKDLNRSEPYPVVWETDMEFGDRREETIAGEVKLAGSYLRSSEGKGSDIRIDVGIPYRPRAGVKSKLWRWQIVSSYKWKRGPGHINRGEPLAAANSFKWRLQSRRGIRKRFLHLVGNQVVLSILAKGRSSSRKPQKPLRQYNALSLFSGCLPYFAHVGTHQNPADKPSRWRNVKPARKVLLRLKGG